MDLNLIHLFDFYLAAMFVLGTARRISQYRAFAGLAESWLRSPVAPVVRVMTLGYINPRQMVHEEVQKALVGASSLINRSLYWTCAQMGLRVAVGLSLWTAWALGV